MANKLPENEAAQIARQTAQCVLLRAIDYVGENVLRTPAPNDSVVKTPVVQNEWGYKNFIKYNTDTPLRLMSDLTANPGMRPLLNIPGHILSVLVPEIRIFKQVFKNEQENDYEIIEFQFDGAYSPEDVSSITEGQAGRASAIGIKSFQWEYLGTNPAESETNIKARLVLHMQSIAILAEEKRSSTGLKYKYMDLLALPDTPYDRCVQARTQRSQYNNKQSRVFIRVGWALPPNAVDSLYNNYTNANPSLPGDIKRIKEAINHAKIDLYLNLMGHDITYNQDGTVELAIDYLAAADSLLNDLKANVFYLDPDYKTFVEKLEKNRQTINNELRKLGSQKCAREADSVTKETADKIKDLQEKLKEEVENDKYKIYNSIVKHLKRNRQIYVIKVKKDLFVAEGDRVLTAEERNKKLQEKITAQVPLEPVEFSVSYTSGDINKKAKPTVDQNDPDRKLIHYFFLGDLLNAALEVLYMPDLNLTNQEDFKVIVGPLSYYRAQRIDGVATGRREKKVVNIADIPISLDLFNVFFTRKVISGLITNYPIQQLLKDVVTGLIQPALDQACTGLGQLQRPRISFQTFSSPIDLFKVQTKNQSQVDKQIIDENTNIPIPAKMTGQMKEGEKFYNYFLMFVSSGDTSFLESDPSDSNPVPENTDAKKGIFWLRTGMDKGMVKNIQFAKSDLPFAREARMRRTGGDADTEGLLDTFTFIREKYNATIELFGTPNFFPGHIIYIDPFGLGTANPDEISKVSRFLGLGGYYVVISVDSFVENGNFQTTLKCEWVSDGSTRSPQLTLEDIGVDKSCEERGKY